MIATVLQVARLAGWLAAGVVEVGEREAAGSGDRVARVHASMEEKLQKSRAWVQPLHARGRPALPLLGGCLMSSDTSVRACLARAAARSPPAGASAAAGEGARARSPTSPEASAPFFPS
jgi:hypothetical protein